MGTQHAVMFKQSTPITKNTKSTRVHRESKQSHSTQNTQNAQSTESSQSTESTQSTQSPQRTHRTQRTQSQSTQSDLLVLCVKLFLIDIFVDADSARRRVWQNHDTQFAGEKSLLLFVLVSFTLLFTSLPHSYLCTISSVHRSAHLSSSM
jgi:hypothetical protein